MSLKPYSGEITGGDGLCPVFQDATGTPITSPIAATETKDLVVPPTAHRLHILPVGSAAATISTRDGSGAVGSGTGSVPGNTEVVIGVAGMGGSPANNLPTIVRVVAGADTPVTFWFDCRSRLGVTV